MSPAAIIIGLLVATGEARTPTTTALVAATAEALEGNVSVVVLDDALPSDKNAIVRESWLGAAAVAQVIWSNAARTRANLRVHLAREGRWIDRPLNFFSRDTPVERGRALGFTLASILLVETELIKHRVAAVAPLNSSRSQPTAMSAGRELANEAPRATEAEGTPASTLLPPSPAAESPPETAVHRAAPPLLDAPRLLSDRLALDLVGVATRGIGGPATGYGGAAHLEFAVTPTIWVRAGAGVRTASLPRLNGDDKATWVSSGGAWRPDWGQRVGVAVYMEVGVVLHDFSHREVTGTIDHAGHLMPVTMLVAEASWRVAPRLKLVIGWGTEVAFGATEVWVAGQLIATVPGPRLLANAGIRFGF